MKPYPQAKYLIRALIVGASLVSVLLLFRTIWTLQGTTYEPVFSPPTATVHIFDVGDGGVIRLGHLPVSLSATFSKPFDLKLYDVEKGNYIGEPISAQPVQPDSFSGETYFAIREASFNGDWEVIITDDDVDGSPTITVKSTSEIKVVPSKWKSHLLWVGFGKTMLILWGIIVAVISGWVLFFRKSTPTRTIQLSQG